MHYFPVLLVCLALQKSSNSHTHELTQSLESEVVANRSEIETPMDVSSTVCGETKGCLLHPPGCSPVSDCELALSYRVEENGWISIELNTAVQSDSSAQFLAVGLSHDRKMGNDSVMACIHDHRVPNQQQLLFFYNVPSSEEKYSRRVFDDDDAILNDPFDTSSLLTLVSMGVSEGRLSCHFRRRITASNFSNRTNANTTLERIFPVEYDRAYYLMIATGNASPSIKDSPPTLGYHALQTPVVSERKIFLTDSYHQELTARDPVKLSRQKWHACLMLVAWMILIPFAISIARYIRCVCKGYPRIWFFLHVLTNIFALLLVFIALLVICFASDWRWLGFGVRSSVPTSTKLHATGGVIALAILLLQPIGACFRCKPTSFLRPIFSWIHAVVGTVAVIASAVVINFARSFDLGLNKARNGSLPMILLIVYWVGFASFPALLEVALCVVHKVLRRRDDNCVSPAIEMRPQQESPLGVSVPIKRSVRSCHSLRRSKAEKWVLTTFLVLFAVFIVAVTTSLMTLIVKFDPDEEYIA